MEVFDNYTMCDKDNHVLNTVIKHEMMIYSGIPHEHAFHIGLCAILTHTCNDEPRILNHIVQKCKSKVTSIVEMIQFKK